MSKLFYCRACDVWDVSSRPSRCSSQGLRRKLRHMFQASDPSSSSAGRTICFSSADGQSLECYPVLSYPILSYPTMFHPTSYILLVFYPIPCYPPMFYPIIFPPHEHTHTHLLDIAGAAVAHPRVLLGHVVHAQAGGVERPLARAVAHDDYPAVLAAGAHVHVVVASAASLAAALAASSGGAADLRLRVQFVVLKDTMHAGAPCVMCVVFVLCMCM